MTTNSDTIASKYKRVVRFRITEELKECLRDREIIEYRGREYFLESIDPEGSVLIRVDRGVKRILEGLIQQRLVPVKVLRTKNTFYCRGAHHIAPTSGRVYGQKKSLAPLDFYCAKCSAELNIVPFQDKWAQARTVLKSRGSKL